MKHTKIIEEINCKTFYTFPNVSWSQTSRINISCNPSSTTKSKVWFQTGFKHSFTTCV